jgi:hypothetical protein
MLDGTGLGVNIEAIKRNIAEAEIISLYFPILRKTFLLDTRTDGNVGPLVCLVEMVDSGQERVRSIRRMRPQLPRPGSITMIPWLGRVESLETQGIWARLLERLNTCGDERCLKIAAACFEELGQLERRELRRAITGEQHRTIWGRLGSGDLGLDGGRRRHR